MVGGFTCARCDQLYEERPGACHECGHEGVETLTFSEYRRRRRAGEEPWTEPESGNRLRTAVLVVMALTLVAVGLAAIGIGVSGMAMPALLPF